MQASPVILFAPLQGYTDAVYRNAHVRIFGGADYYYTPFVRLEKGTFRNKEMRDVDPGQNETPLVPQLIAGKPEEFRLIVSRLVQYGYKRVDINMGCPFPLQVHRHRGAGILPYPEEAEALLETIHEYPGIRFSIKMRLGWNKHEECFSLLPFLNELPLEHITLHPRLGIRQYKGFVDLEAFGRFYEACNHPLFYNGDIRTKEDVETLCIRFPRLRGVMLGRGLLSDPFLAGTIRGTEYTPEDQQMLLKRFHSELFENYAAVLQGDHQLLAKMKTVWEYLLPGADKRLRKKIIKSVRISQYSEAVQTLLSQYPDV